jgi:peptidyl-prolyl cis-trans isomerase C
MNRLLAFTLGAAMAGGLAQAQDTPTAATVLATVNGTEITLGHVIALRGRLPEQYQSLPDDVLLDGILEQLIQQTVLAQSMEGEIDARLTATLENERRTLLAGERLQRVTEQEVTDEALKEAYEARFADLLPENEYNASHILVATEDEAKALIAKLEAGADFAELARENSTGPSGPNGGDLGWFGAGQMVKPFEDAVLGLAVGEVSAPVETQFGWHVVKLNDMRTKAAPTLDEMREELAMDLQRQRIEQELDRLTAEATITRREDKIDPALIRDVNLFDK